jgi:hypothetical protein
VFDGVQMPAKPIGRQARNRFERAGFFKEMRRAGHDFQLLRAAKFRKRFLVQPDYHLIVFTQDEQRRRLHAP